MKIKTMMTAILTVTMMFCLGACKNSAESSDLGSSVSTESTATNVATTTTAKSVTTTARTTATTVKLTTTTTTAVTTAPTTTATSAKVTVATTTTVKPQTAAPTAQTQAPATSAANVATTTTAPVTMPSNVASTVYMIQDDVTLEYEPITVYYYDEKPENATLQAYSDLAEYGILTDEIRELITADVMGYAYEKYGLKQDTSLYANSTTDYNASFYGGVKNNEYSQPLYPVACMIKWGIRESDYIVPSLNEQAKKFRQKMHDWVDSELEFYAEIWEMNFSDIDWSNGFGNLGFCELARDENGYVVYQLSFLG